jgi:hypothetical protein
MKIIIDKHISDYDSVKRTWKERLFSLPWRPWVKMKSVHAPKVYKTGDTIICSPKTEANIRASLNPQRNRFPDYYCPSLGLSYDDVHDFDR